ncbi:MAG: glycosyltransferase family A protein [Candidatus Competibacter sp.]
MTHRPLVSVIIPAYNAEHYIDEALHSILSQTYPNIEIIVINDKSSDRTEERVASYLPQVTCLTQNSSGGYPGSPRNTGLTHCKGELICFLDADDMMRPARVETQVNFLVEHPQVGVVFTDYRNFSNSGVFEETHFQTCPNLWQRLKSHPRLVLESIEATSLLIQENFGLPSSMMIRREVLDVAPGFSTAFQIGEDFHFYYRIARRFSVGIINQVETDRRLHENNITGDPIKMLHNYIASRSDLRTSEPNRDNIKILDGLLYRCEINLARAYANQRQFSRSFLYNLRALRYAFPYRLDRVAGGLRTLVRMGMIAAHLKN